MPLTITQAALRQARVPSSRARILPLAGVDAFRAGKAVMVTLAAADDTQEPLFRLVVDSWRARAE